MVILQCSEDVPHQSLNGYKFPLHQQWVKHVKICMEHQISYFYTLIDWLLRATIGNHGHSLMNLQYL